MTSQELYRDVAVAVKFEASVHKAVAFNRKKGKGYFGRQKRSNYQEGIRMLLAEMQSTVSRVIQSHIVTIVFNISIFLAPRERSKARRGDAQAKLNEKKGRSQSARGITSLQQSGCLKKA
jgi:hypothetical protein